MDVPFKATNLVVLQSLILNSIAIIRVYIAVIKLHYPSNLRRKGFISEYFLSALSSELIGGA